MAKQTTMTPEADDYAESVQQRTEVKQRIESNTKVVKTAAGFLKDYQKMIDFIWGESEDADLAGDFTGLALTQAQAMTVALGQIMDDVALKVRLDEQCQTFESNGITKLDSGFAEV